MEKIDIRELCFIKMLLIRNGYFNDAPIIIEDLERITNLKRQYFIGPLKHLLELQIISFGKATLNIEYTFDYQDQCTKFWSEAANIEHCTETNPTLYKDPYCELGEDRFNELIKEKSIPITIDDVILSINLGFPVRPIEYCRFVLNIDISKLNQYLDKYLINYREDKFKTDELFDFKTQDKIISALIAETTDKDIAQLTENEKNNPFGISVVITGGNLEPANFDLAEIVLNIERDGLIKIISIDLPERNLGNLSIKSQLKIGLLVGDYKNNKILLTNKSDNAISYRFHNHEIPTGYLKIGNYPEKRFTKIPALIINYFYETNKIDQSFKDYQHFKAHLTDPQSKLTSDDFSKKIILINNKVNHITKKMLPAVIIRGKNKKNEANIYRWLSNLP